MNFAQIYRFWAPKLCFYSYKGGRSVNKVPLGVNILGQKLS
jgi:hypothetical protein